MYIIQQAELELKVFPLGATLNALSRDYKYVYVLQTLVKTRRPPSCATLIAEWLLWWSAYHLLIPFYMYSPLFTGHIHKHVVIYIVKYLLITFVCMPQNLQYVHNVRLFVVFGCGYGVIFTKSFLELHIIHVRVVLIGYLVYLAIKLLFRCPRNNSKIYL